jgi:hypothetical protein
MNADDGNPVLRAAAGGQFALKVIAGMMRHGMFWEHWQLGDDGRFTLTDAGQAHLAARRSRAGPDAGAPASPSTGAIALPVIVEPRR